MTEEHGSDRNQTIASKYVYKFKSCIKEWIRLGWSSTMEISNKRKS